MNASVEPIESANEQALIKEVLKDARKILEHRPPLAENPRIASSASKAIEKAMVIRQLKQQYESTGFLAMPLDRYIQNLAQQAGLDVSPVVKALAHRNDESGLSGWIALSQAMGTRLEHLRLWVRTWFAQEWQMNLPSRSMARSLGPCLSSALKTSVPTTPQDAEERLQEIEPAYSPEHQRCLTEALETLT